MQLAKENELKYPKESQIIANSFYIDDLLTGADSVEELVELQRDISKILLTAGFELRKWLCNNLDILNTFFVNKHVSASVLEIGTYNNNKTLGIVWDARDDTIKYSIWDFNNKVTYITKRQILSLVCQIYDPLGLLGSVLTLNRTFYL